MKRRASYYCFVRIMLSVGVILAMSSQAYAEWWQSPKLEGSYLSPSDQYGAAITMDGNLAINGLEPGASIVAEKHEDSWLQTYPFGNGTHVVSVDNNQNVSGIELGNYLDPECQDYVWDLAEYCGHDAYYVTGSPDMTHDCKLDFFDLGQFGLGLFGYGSPLSADLNGDGAVNIGDVGLFSAAFSLDLDVSPCELSGTRPDIWGGELLLSFSSDPNDIVDTHYGTTGVYNVYVVAGNCPELSALEYTLEASSNLILTEHSGVEPFVDLGSDCESDPNRWYDTVHATAAVVVDPATVASLTFFATDEQPAWIKLIVGNQVNCPGTGIRWGESTYDRKINFTYIHHAGFNGPPPIPTDTPEERVLPSAYVLHPCYPNPFNPLTRIRFDIPQACTARLKIYTLDGKYVATIIDDYVSVGSHEAIWGGRDAQGRKVASGVYIYRLQAGNFVESKRMMLLK